MSTEVLCVLAKEVVGGGSAGKWKFDKEHRFLFIDKIAGGAIPREFIAPIEAGIREALDNGILAGFPTVDVAVVLIDGSYHDVDSNEMAFKIAGSMAYKESRGKQRHSRGSAAGADVRLRHGFAQPHAGARDVYDALFTLCGIARGAGGRSHQEAPGRKVVGELCSGLSEF